ncbi:large subunit ribosomal protein L9 [Actinobaculum suis]|uniref:Large ribosomal subunit protein bL9 n=1 Tax=Actinobaculum suis TaxID=1657 RepID=A0A0K9ES97_9ACTO|nr:50S ribosomal protein L9 [Actinobaculum suis]KMY22765.1 50S ribosomal protein L9 [Actinobaculum suis]MDY5152713.1 50S ribosomal protein L9 [Actinobaculum suis]OCA95062.1 50S ribosomal protein L9 [Actinobaculum suis]OCA95776.1 50S ribosomal protein L9 [Actinobaculum suis]SDE09246.1 large subunit ribosomal protein L9 [Actinobaculum suis]
MKIILTHDVDRLGQAGDVVEVKPGYGRNYLIPQGYATPWTKGAQRQIDQMAEARRRRAITDLEQAHALRDALVAEPLRIEKNAGESGRLFGAVSTRDIAEAATEKTGKPVDRRWIHLAKPIKSVGQHKARVKIADDVVADLEIEVVSASKGK